jgi:hypothetical protein
MFAIGWIGMALLMSIAIATTNLFDIPVQTVYVFAVGVTLRELLGIVSWMLDG